MAVKVIGIADPPDDSAIDTVSRSKSWSKELSPFFLGPGPLYVENEDEKFINFENFWQFSKVYKEYTDENGEPTEAYFMWRKRGFKSKWAYRYPMGKGRKPEYSLGWNGEKLGYIEARKKLYIPGYASLVIHTDAFKKLDDIYEKNGTVTLWDFDGYDFKKLGMTLKDVVNCAERKMGHAFVLAMLLMSKGICSAHQVIDFDCKLCKHDLSEYTKGRPGDLF